MSSSKVLWMANTVNIRFHQGVASECSWCPLLPTALFHDLDLLTWFNWFSDRVLWSLQYLVHGLPAYTVNTGCSRLLLKSFLKWKRCGRALFSWKVCNSQVLRWSVIPAGELAPSIPGRNLSLKNNKTTSWIDGQLINATIKSKAHGKVPVCLFHSQWCQSMKDRETTPYNVVIKGSALVGYWSRNVNSHSQLK